MLVCVIGSITIGLQSWVGDNTIYSTEFDERREELHDAILANRAPRGGTWGAVGAAALNLRVGVVYLAEGVRTATGLTLHKTYKLIDTVFLFAALVGLFFYLKQWVPEVYCIIGLLYFCSMLPLSYFMHLFQPWDRAQLAMWIALLYLVRVRKPVLLGAVLAVSMIVKFDTILVPGFYFLVHVSRDHWRRVLLESLALFALTFGVYLGLVWLFPAPLDPARFSLESAANQIARNMVSLRLLHVAYPPLLLYAIPVLLAVIGIWRRDRFLWASMFFAVGLSAIFFMFTEYKEVRSQLVVLVLVLPAALLSLQDLIARRGLPA